MRVPQGVGSRGSLKWIQRMVAAEPGPLRDAFVTAGALKESETIEWVSPLATDDWAEYRDKSYLEKVGYSNIVSELSHFWPAGGPQWDALGRGPRGSVFLIEAKAHVSEMDSNCHASAGSRVLIQQSLSQAKVACGANPDADWLTGYYQYANRLANLHFLRRNRIPAWLGFVYFLNDRDMGGPQTSAGWEHDLGLVYQHLGLKSFGQIPGVVDIFIDCAELVAT